MASSPQTPPGDAPDLDALREAIASGDPTRAMPALTQLRFCSDEEAVPLLVLGTQQQAFLVRSLSCSGLGYKRTDQGWTVLEQLLGSEIVKTNIEASKKVDEAVVHVNTASRRRERGSLRRPSRTGRARCTTAK